MEQVKSNVIDIDSRLVTIYILSSRFNELNIAIKELNRTMVNDGIAYRFNMKLLSDAISSAKEINQWVKSETYNTMIKETRHINSDLDYNIKYTSKTIKTIKKIENIFIDLKDNIYDSNEVSNLLHITRSKSTMNLFYVIRGYINDIILLNKAYMSLIRNDKRIHH